MAVAGDPEPNLNPQVRPSRWDALIWPRWLPLRARLPLIAQIAGAAALIAAVAMPRWTGTPIPATPPAAAAAEIPQPVPATTTAAATTPAPAPDPPRPAHLNLDVRHKLRSVDLSVTVDGKSVLETKLAGGGKRFGVIGKRAERGFTRTIEVAPGVRIVRVRVRSAEDKFDQTRVERFDLDSAAVASIRIAAEKSGLTLVADRPTPTESAPVAQAVPASGAVAQASVVPQPAQLQQGLQGADAAQSAQEATALAELYQSLRSILIAMAGFIASVASGFLFEEFLKSRNLSPFQPTPSAPPGSDRSERRRRVLRRARNESDISIDAGLS
jgi:hypothetical protein